MFLFRIEPTPRRLNTNTHKKKVKEKDKIGRERERGKVSEYNKCGKELAKLQEVVTETRTVSMATAFLLFLLPTFFVPF